MANAIRRGKWQIAVLAIGTCAALNASAYTDGEVIAHFPFDTDYLSIVNTSCNPAAAETFGTVASGAQDIKAAGVCDILSASIRANGGCLSINKGRVAIDITKFNLDSDHARYFTIEFLFKGNLSEIGEWNRMVDIGNASTMTGDCGVDSPYILELARQGDHTYGKIQTDKSSTSFINPADSQVYDGEWHHIAYVLKKYTATQDCVDFYVDGKWLKSGDHSGWSGASNYFSWPKPEEGKKRYLVLGSNTGTMKCLIDELRITAGSLTTGQFLRFTDDVMPPVNGETLLWMSFDNSIATKAHGGELAPYVESGTAVYSPDVWKTLVGSVDKTTVPPVENLACFSSPAKNNLKVVCPYWALHSGSVDSATVECFMKGSGGDAAWQSALAINDGSGDFPLCFTFGEQTPKRFYCRADLLAPREGYVGDKKMFKCDVYGPTTASNEDGRWHHIAYTFEKTQTGGCKVRLYFDYLKIGSWDVADFSWSGFRPADALWISKNCGACVDEFRITKGVLPVGKFLKARDVGMMLIFR